MELNLVAILFRALHVLGACVLIGSIYFFCFVLSSDSIEPTSAASWRKKFKLTVHVTLLLFLVTGVYNAMRNWPIYSSRPGLMHAMFGIHILLGLTGITVVMIMLAGREAKMVRAGMARWALLVLMLGVGAASTLKSAREWTVAHVNAVSTDVANVGQVSR